MEHSPVSARHAAVRRGRRALCVLTLLLGAAGCAALPGERPLSQPSLPRSYAVAQSFSASPRGWPSDDWWRAYDEPQLSALIEEGLSHAPDLRVAAARFAAAKALAEQSASLEAPSLDAEGQFGAT